MNAPLLPPCEACGVREREGVVHACRTGWIGLGSPKRGEMVDPWTLRMTLADGSTRDIDLPYAPTDFDRMDVPTWVEPMAPWVPVEIREPSNAARLIDDRIYAQRDRTDAARREDFCRDNAIPFGE
jgi:hypothetical protein